MEVTRFAEGLWRWTAFYEEWRDEVGCVYLEAPDAIVLIDPLVPSTPAEAARFWEALDRDVRRAGVPVHVLVTVFWHARSAGEVVHRYGGRLHATSRARAAIQRRTEAVTDVFRPGDRLPGGVEALPSGRATEVVYWIPRHRTLVPGDVILGREDGGLRLCPESWLPAGVGHARLREALKPLLDLPVERVLVSHGAPVTEDARARLAEALTRC
jgi:glyoxylase-like metal-dependent hydrolase (beta-lactamase superfamily II)